MAYLFFVKGIRRLNEEKVMEKLTGLMGRTTDRVVDVGLDKPHDDEIASYRLSVRQQSTTGVNVRYLWNGNIMVELPWLASLIDVYLCYALLNAVKKTHRTAHVVNKNEKEVKLNSDAMEHQWEQIRANMAELLCRNERTVIAGRNRSFFINPQRYTSMDADDMTQKAFDDFVRGQWTLTDANILMEEQRHVSDDEEKSTVRVTDNTGDVFIGECRYVGMMNGKDCKMVPFDDFCMLMRDEEEFVLLDDAQACLCKMESDKWLRLYDEAQGKVIRHFRKTFIMRWNTDISNHRLHEFQKAMDDFDTPDFYYDWSIWDHKKAFPGDRFYMVRTGEGRQGIVMRGSLAGLPYPDEDWSGKGRKVFYVRMHPDAMLDPESDIPLLSTESLSDAINDFNWTEGHSGEMLNDEQADALERLWQDYMREISQDSSSAQRSRFKWT